MSPIFSRASFSSGVAAASAISPQINLINLTDNSPGGSRFTSSTFDYSYTMTKNGSPASVKKITASVIGGLTQNVETDTITSVQLEDFYGNTSSPFTKVKWSNYLSVSQGSLVAGSSNSVFSGNQYAGARFSGSGTMTVTFTPPTPIPCSKASVILWTPVGTTTQTETLKCNGTTITSGLNGFGNVSFTPTGGAITNIQIVVAASSGSPSFTLYSIFADDCVLVDNEIKKATINLSGSKNLELFTKNTYSAQSNYTFPINSLTTVNWDRLMIGDDVTSGLVSSHWFTSNLTQQGGYAAYRSISLLNFYTNPYIMSIGDTIGAYISSYYGGGTFIINGASTGTNTTGVGWNDVSFNGKVNSLSISNIGGATISGLRINGTQLINDPNGTIFSPAGLVQDISISGNTSKVVLHSLNGSSNFVAGQKLITLDNKIPYTSVTTSQLASYNSGASPVELTFNSDKDFEYINTSYNWVTQEDSNQYSKYFYQLGGTYGLTFTNTPAFAFNGNLSNHFGTYSAYASPDFIFFFNPPINVNSSLEVTVTGSPSVYVNGSSTASSTGTGNLNLNFTGSLGSLRFTSGYRTGAGVSAVTVDGNILTDSSDISGFINSINTSAKVITLNSNNGTFQANKKCTITGVNAGNVENYLDLDSSYNVQDILKSLSTITPPIASNSGTITFPSILPSGIAPDTTLSAGTKLKIQIEATNKVGIDIERVFITPV